MKKVLLTIIAMLLASSSLFAYDLAVENADGITIYYNWKNSEKTELSVTNTGYNNNYSGNIVIPGSVEYEGNTYNVTSIEESAFKYCSELTSITIPNGVLSIGYRAFYQCSKLASVTIPNSVTSINNQAFYGCTNLANIEIPESVEFIGDEVFNGTAWFFNQPNGLVYAGMVAYKYKGEMPANTSIILKDGTLGICQNAFYYCVNMTSVVIPNSLKNIGSNAFSYCTGLTTITIPKSVISIGDYAFQNCNLITITSEIESPFAINDILWGNYSNTTLIVPKNTKTIYQATSGWNNFTNILEVGEGGIIGKSFISDGIQYTIGDNNTCTLVSCTDKSKYSAVIPGRVAFNGMYYNVTSIGSSAFSGCSNLLSVVIPNSVTSIASYAFSDCSKLSSIIIGSGVTSIQYRAFNGTSISKVIWLTNTPPTGYDNIRGSINYVSNDQFGMLSNVVKYPFLSSMFEVDGIRYAPVSLSERTCDAIDCVYNESSAITKIPLKVTYKGIELNVQKVQPYVCFNNQFVNHLSMEMGGTVSQHAFNGCKNMLTAILGSVDEGFKTDNFSGLYIGSNISRIDNYVFGGCEKLNKLHIADRESELSLGNNNNPLFYSCPLESVYIGGDITYEKTASAGYSPFYRNTAIKSVTITDKETEISENEFYGCTNLQRVSIGDGLTTIGDWAFSGCQSLSYFAFGSQLQTIGKESFSDCTNVIEIISKASTPPVCGSQALDDINKWDCKLYVPDGSLPAYQAADQWKEFLFAEEGTGTAEQNPSGEGPQKCGTPKINYTGDKLSFASDTEGAKFVYRVTSADEKYGSGNEVELKKTYTITVYATKEGYADSDVAKTTIEAGGSGVFGDLTGDGVVNVADHVKLSDIIMNQGN